MTNRSRTHRSSTMNAMMLVVTALLSCVLSAAAQGRVIAGRIVDQTGAVVIGARVEAGGAGCVAVTGASNAQGEFHLLSACSGAMELRVTGAHLAETKLALADKSDALRIVVERRVAGEAVALVVRDTTIEPELEHRRAELFDKTLFSRDDQLFDVLAAGINAGQHEGGGKSVEVRRFGFNLDHGGVNGGLKVLVDDVPQNQPTQGHGQGYLGQLKSLTPELIEEVELINGPFSAAYGDFSGLGVAHIRLRERLPDAITLRGEGGSFNGWRTLGAWSPRADATDAFFAYETAYTDGPFLNPLKYRRDNVTGNWTRRLSAQTSLGLRASVNRNDFDSSGQLPLDEVAAGRLDRFGYVDPHDGGRTRGGQLAAYFARQNDDGSSLRADAAVQRQLFDLWSNFTFYLNDPAHGDEIQQHDSRLRLSANVQGQKPWRWLGSAALLNVGANYTDEGIDVGLLHTEARKVLATTTRARVRLDEGAIYAQNAVESRGGRLRVEFGLRGEGFGWRMNDRVGADSGGAAAWRWQPKAALAWRPWAAPVKVHFNYGRGVNSQDARGVVERPRSPRVATTDFTQIGATYARSRWSAALDMFLIDHSNEQVYVPDDGSFELKGATRSYGWEAKLAAELVRRLSLEAGWMQVTNAFYKGTSPREYVDSAPHSVGDVGLTFSGWRGVASSLRWRHAGGYIVDPLDRTARASGLDVVDWSGNVRLRRWLELSAAVDNLADHRYWETQNWFESRLTPSSPAASRVHATPGYGRGFRIGLTYRR